jgi:hypothetical protein
VICIDDLMKTTLKETSFDDHNQEYMTQSTLQVINFDKLKEEFFKKINNDTNRMFCSNDALFICNDDEIYMIEFKNGKIDQNTIYNLFWKNFDSILIYMHYKVQDIERIKSNLNYILVYNEEKNKDLPGTNQSISQSNSRNQLGQSLAKKAKKEFIQFGLGYFKDYIFKDVYTLNKSQFEDRFLKIWELQQN